VFSGSGCGTLTRGRRAAVPHAGARSQRTRPASATRTCGGTRVFDEGGRALLLVAQIAERWGTRQTSTGKSIWAGQSLPAAAPA
jgi:hypothetical protein